MTGILAGNAAFQVEAVLVAHGVAVGVVAAGNGAHHIDVLAGGHLRGIQIDGADIVAVGNGSTLSMTLFAAGDAADGPDVAAAPGGGIDGAPVVAAVDGAAAQLTGDAAKINLAKADAGQGAGIVAAPDLNIAEGTADDAADILVTGDIAGVGAVGNGGSVAGLNTADDAADAAGALVCAAAAVGDDALIVAVRDGNGAKSLAQNTANILAVRRDRHIDIGGNAGNRTITHGNNAGGIEITGDRTGNGQVLDGTGGVAKERHAAGFAGGIQAGDGLAVAVEGTGKSVAQSQDLGIAHGNLTDGSPCGGNQVDVARQLHGLAGEAVLGDTLSGAVDDGGQLGQLLGGADGILSSGAVAVPAIAGGLFLFGSLGRSFGGFLSRLLSGGLARFLSGFFRVGCGLVLTQRLRLNFRLFSFRCERCQIQGGAHGNDHDHDQDP